MEKIVKSLGIVFGDIGTSPIYTLTVILLFVESTPDNIIGVLSLIVWTLILLVAVQYAWLATSLSKNGEGGTIVLTEILTPYLKKGKRAAVVAVISYVGISLLIGDGVITPAISILSAVEGVKLIPAFAEITQTKLIIAAALIAVLLFVFQKRGTEGIAFAFGPLMLLWFAALSISGIMSIASNVSVLKAFNPYYGLNFAFNHGITGFFILSEVILCATGGEALYADMGHLGREPILKAWWLVFVALLINYLGQGSFAINHPDAKNILFEMVYSQFSFLYIPFLLLSIAATVIASQAMISGMFSIVYQGITTHIMPLFKVDYTSTEMQSQIYISSVNWFLLACVIFIMFEFKESHNLAAAYGLAVSGTMLLTAFLMSWIFFYRKEFLKCGMSVLILIINTVFLGANSMKIPHGGYWSLVIAAFPLATIFIYTSGQKRLHRAMKPLNLEAFLIGYKQIYDALPKIRGTALFFAKSDHDMAPYIVHTMFKNNIIYEDNVIVSLRTTDDPYGLHYYFRDDLAKGLRSFEIKSGYMEVIDVEAILKEVGINEKTIFYGIEEISTNNIVWKIFFVIKRITPTFLQFYKLPSNKLHGVVTRVEM